MSKSNKYKNRNRNLVLRKLEGYAGIRLKENKALTFRPGLNLLVGRNGSGKTNLIRLIQQIANGQGDIKDRIESSIFHEYATSALKKKGSNLLKSFGEIPIVKYSYQGSEGSIVMSLKGGTAEKYVLKNILSDSGSVGSAVDLKGQSAKVKYRPVYGGHSPPKFEMSGYINFNLFSKEHDNAAHAIMEGPIRDVSVFMRERMLEFYEGIEFIEKVNELERSINSRFTSFLGNTNKTVKINCSEIRSTGRVYLSLMDNKNFIQSSDISTGEAALLNLIFFLMTAKDEGWDIISFDEPDIHMHDDMIEVLVHELSELSIALPNCIIVVASHSTALIEKLAALGRNGVNIVSFDGQRKVANSQDDIDLINALTRNGVTFSPLMLSRKQNIFIENLFKHGGNNHRDFFLKFFPEDNKPNIIPIGTSGNVQDSESFMGVFTEILKISNVRSTGIQDGDIWFKAHLTKYMKGELSLNGFLKLLKSQKGVYIKSDIGKNSYFFNFWEIENLYVMPELLKCWKPNKSNPLTTESFMELLNRRREIISFQYFDTFYKFIAKVRPKEKATVANVREQINKKLISIGNILEDDKALESRMSKLVDEILKNRLIQWIPGKEITEALKQLGYVFNENELQFDKLKLSTRIRRIQ